MGSFRVYLSLSSTKEREGGEKRARRVGRGRELRQPPLTADGVGRVRRFERGMRAIEMNFCRRKFAIVSAKYGI